VFRRPFSLVLMDKDVKDSILIVRYILEVVVFYTSRERALSWIFP
jgi:hypothetical protein